MLVYLFSWNSIYISSSLVIVGKKVSSKYDSVLSFVLCLLDLWLVLNTIIEIIISFRIFGDEESEENND